MKKSVLAMIGVLALLAAGFGWYALQGRDGNAGQSESDDAAGQAQAAAV
ncbi:MAG: hypothetical protein P8J20_01505 [Novosphingobium sp.]|nr:hypothetical protein [Novosphingobium sp.]